MASNVRLRYTNASGTAIVDKTYTSSVSKTLTTSGTYCEGDILVDYTAPSIQTLKDVDNVQLGSAINPSSGYDAMATVKLGRNTAITVPPDYTLTAQNYGTVIVSPSKQPGYPNITTYDSTNAENAATGLNATLGGNSTNTITFDQGSNNTLTYVDGTVTTDGLAAPNIRQGISILGVTGTYAASSTASGIYSAQYANTISATQETSVGMTCEVSWTSSHATGRSYNLDSSVTTNEKVKFTITGMIKGATASQDPSINIYFENSSGTKSSTFTSISYSQGSMEYTTAWITVPSGTWTKIYITKTSSGSIYVTGWQNLCIYKQLSIPSGYYGVVTASGGTTLTDASSYQYIAVKQGSATNPTTTQTGASASLSGTTLTLSKSVTPSVTAGWINSGTAATVKLSGTVPTETKTATGSGDITPNSGKLLSKVTVPAAGTTLTMTGAAVTDEVTIGTLSSGYYPVNAKVKGTVKPNAAGWVSTSGLGAAQATTATQVGKIVAGSFASTTSTATATALTANTKYKLAKGYYASDAYYTTPSGGITPSGNIQITSQGSSSSPIDVTSYAGAYVKGGTMSVKAATPSVTGSWNSSTNKYVVTATAPAPVNNGTQTAGWVSSVTKSAGTNGTLNIAKAVFEVSGASIKTTSSGAGYIPASTTVGTVSSMTLPTSASSSSSGTTKATITPGSSAQYINIPTGYNGSAANYKINAISLEDGGTDTLHLGQRYTPSSGYSGMSGFTIMDVGASVYVDSGTSIADLHNNDFIGTIYNNGDIYSIENAGSLSISQNTRGTAHIDLEQDSEVTVTHDNGGEPVDLGYDQGGLYISLDPVTASFMQRTISGLGSYQGPLFSTIDISSAASLYNILTLDTQLYRYWVFKYTGSTTTYSGVTFTNGNIYINNN